MKKILLLFILVLFYTQNITADNFKVKSFKKNEMDLTARKNEVLDANDEPCALIKVRTSLRGLGFNTNNGMVEKSVELHDGDYWFYVSPGTRRIRFFKSGFATIDYDLPVRINSYDVYILTLDVEKTTITTLPVTIIIEPGQAKLLIDGKAAGKGTSHKLAIGKHNLVISQKGYQTIDKIINVDEQHTYFNYKLEEEPQVLTQIQSIPDNAILYIDNIKIGNTPISFFYQPGIYTIKLERNGYLTLQEKLTIAQPKTNKTYTLIENVGYLTIKTFKTATVKINEKIYTDLKNIKFSPQLLNIEVSMPKAEKLNKQQLIKKDDNIILELYPEIQTATIQIAVTPFDAKVEITGDAGEKYSSEGAKIFKDIPIGNYTVLVKAKGYKNKTESIKLKAGEIKNLNVKLEKGASLDIEMVFVKGGTFKMGSNNDGSDEKPVHEVTVDDFYIGKYEVTQKQWKEIMGSNPSHFKGDNLPVESVSWNDIQKFIKKLNKKTGKHYRLPTEAEWEYAARGGVETIHESSQTKYAGSNNIDNVAWYWKNSGDEILSGDWDWDKIEKNNCKTHAVGTKQANELGIYDMSGNVWEWCNDWYDGSYYSNSPRNNPQGPASSSSRVFRGGSWNDYAGCCRVALRYYISPGDCYSYMGFRLALVP